MDESLARVASHKVFDQGCLAGACLPGDGDDAPPASIRLSECLIQALQLIVPF
jgi:hypothetical protein